MLPREVIAQLALRPGLIVVDGTVGAAGHSRLILSRIQPGGRLIGLDRDPMMLDHARRSLVEPDAVGPASGSSAVTLIHSSYRDLRGVLDSMQLPAVDRVLLDLGLSSDQLADRSRGFGIDAGGTLDMRFDAGQGRSAAEWLRSADESTLADVLHRHGEVPRADAIAKELISRQRQRPVETVADLTAAIEAASPASRGNKSVVAQVFQALRIAVNSELDHLQQFLSTVLPACLKPGGLAAIISFHSLEDRLVKQAFQEADWRPVTRKPIEATPAEARINPRSRSARLRVAEYRTTDEPRT